MYPEVGYLFAIAVAFVAIGVGIDVFSRRRSARRRQAKLPELGDGPVVAPSSSCAKPRSKRRRRSRTSASCRVRIAGAERSLYRGP